jgi:vancomycin resistance protein YoaR
LTLLHAWPEPSSIRLWRRRQRQRWALAAVAAALGVPAFVWVLLLSGVNPLGEIRVGGVLVERTAAGAAQLAQYAQRWDDGRFLIRVGPYLGRYARVHLGAHLPPGPAQAAVLALGRSGNPLRDLSDLWTSRTSGLALPWHVEVAREALAARIQELRNRLERPPVPGALLADGSELPGTPGLTVDLLGSVDRVARALASRADSADLPVVRVAPPRSVRYASSRSGGTGQFVEVMSEFSTKYRTSGVATGRARNIELAAAALDGAVIEPGSELSFNQKVGQRSYDRGFEAALELANRRVVRGVGGGVCQVAATLHAAAFFGGFALTEYRPHSRPARYIELGLDTMVSWPQQDMRIANVYPFPVRVRVLAEQGHLQVRLEGASKAHPVEWSKEILERVRPGVLRIEDPGLGPGESKVVQEAIDGVTLRRKRVVYWPTGPKQEESVLRYPPNDRILAVGSRGASADSALTAGAYEPEDF